MRFSCVALVLRCRCCCWRSLRRASVSGSNPHWQSLPEGAASPWTRPLVPARVAATRATTSSARSDMRVGADGLTDGLWTRADYCALEARGDLPGQPGLRGWSRASARPAPSLLLAVGDAPGVPRPGGGAAAAPASRGHPPRVARLAFLAWAVVASAHNRGGTVCARRWRGHAARAVGLGRASPPRARGRARHRRLLDCTSSSA